MSSISLSTAGQAQYKQRRMSTYPHPPTNTTKHPQSSNTKQETKEQWTSIKLSIGDSQHFLDLISALHWRDGLTIEAVNLINKHLSCDTESRVEGSNRTASGWGHQEQTGCTLVTYTAAKHAAEVIGIMFGFAGGMVRFTEVYKAHLLATERLNRYVYILT